MIECFLGSISFCIGIKDLGLSGLHGLAPGWPDYCTHCMYSPFDTCTSVVDVTCMALPNAYKPAVDGAGFNGWLTRTPPFDKSIA